VSAPLEDAYAAMECSAPLDRFLTRHGIEALPILTVTDDEHAARLVEHLRPRIEGRVVVEIGAGIGLLAMHVADVAFKVYAIEANPVWASSFAVAFMDRKPKNLTFVYGAADELAGVLRADVALFCTHSGAASMRAAGALFAPVVIDVYREILWNKADVDAETAALVGLRE
jgi:hypothetical protein